MGHGLVPVGMVVGAVVVLALARTRPGYDPYGWLAWGYQTVHTRLDLGGAPSWKPLPALFTVPYALAGSSQLRLWMTTAIWISLAGCVFAGRIAYRAVRVQAGGGSVSGATRSWAPGLAAIFAAVGVLGIQDYVHYILSGQSDPMIATFCLGAIDLHLCRRYRPALAFVVLAALGRPEVWPFLGMYAIWTSLRVPGMRWIALGGLVLVVSLWFGVPWITNGRPDVAGQLAMNTRQVLHHGQVTGTIRQFTQLQYLPIWLAALAGVVISGRRGNRVVLILTGSVALWVVIEIALALRRFPVLPRFMFEGAALAAVLAGIGAGLLVIELPKLWRPLPRWSGVAVVAVLAVFMVPEAIARINAERVDLQNQRNRSAQIRLLETTINSLGGYRTVRACGEPVTNVAYASALAWLTRLNVGRVGYKPSRERLRSYATVFFLPVSHGGWKVQPWHTGPTELTPCARLEAAYLPSGASLSHYDNNRVRRRGRRRSVTGHLLFDTRPHGLQKRFPGVSQRRR